MRGYRDKHSPACRQRFAELLKDDHRRKKQIEDAEERRVRAKVKKPKGSGENRARIQE